MKHTPAEAYIKRGIELESLQVRVSAALKLKAEIAAEKLGTSLNRFTEAALNWYIKQLEKDGSI
jgi:predicted HicB family RNase H-like nuclease